MLLLSYVYDGPWWDNLPSRLAHLETLKYYRWYYWFYPQFYQFIDDRRHILTRSHRLLGRSNSIFLSRERSSIHRTPSSYLAILTSFSALFLLASFVFAAHAQGSWQLTLHFSILFFIILFGWGSTVIGENLAGRHTKAVKHGLYIGFFLFIVSEIMLFFSFFWAYLYFAMSPTVWVGSIWPYLGISSVNPWAIPLLNTVYLLTSGVWVNLCNLWVQARQLKRANRALIMSVFLGLLFLYCQYFEYTTAGFSIASGIYGSSFYMLTGLHGAHVIIGVLFLISCFWRLKYGFFTTKNHMGLLISIYYWHFVDVVWLLLFLIIYVWN